MLVALAVGGIVVLVATSDGLNDYQGRPLGTDFSNIYAAGKYVLEGKPAAAFDPRQQHAREQAIFGPATPFYGWHYPPVFLFVAALLALLPYLPALFVWQAVTLALYLKAQLFFLPRRPARGRDGSWLSSPLAFPAVFVNLGHGNNGFLTAALFGLRSPYSNAGRSSRGFRSA